MCNGLPCWLRCPPPLFCLFQNLPGSSNGVGVSLRKPFRLSVRAACPRTEPTALAHATDAVFRGRSAGSEVSRAPLSTTEDIDGDVDDDYRCERCRASGAIRTGDGLQQQRQRQPKEGSAEGCEAVSSTANVTANSANQIIREIRRSVGERMLRGSSTDDDGPRDTAAAQAKKAAITAPEVLPFESKDIRSEIPARVADYDEMLEEFLGAEKKGQEVGQWQSVGVTGGSERESRNSKRNLTGSSIVGEDAGLSRRRSLAAVPFTTAQCSGRTSALDSVARLGVEVVGRTKKEDTPYGSSGASGTVPSRPPVGAVETSGLSTVRGIDAAGNHDVIDGSLVKRFRSSFYARDGCGHERECGEIMERNIGKTKRNNSGDGDDEEILEERKREIDGSRDRGQEPPPPPAARIEIGCRSGGWFWLELLETWAFFLVLLVFLVRQVRRYWKVLFTCILVNRHRLYMIGSISLVVFPFCICGLHRISNFFGTCTEC